MDREGGEFGSLLGWTFFSHSLTDLRLSWWKIAWRAVVREKGLQFACFSSEEEAKFLYIALKQYIARSAKMFFWEGCLQWQSLEKLEMMVPQAQSQ